MLDWAASHFNIKAKLDVTTGLASPNPPVLAWDLSQHNLRMIARHAEHFEIRDDVLIQRPFCIKRPPSDGIDTNVRVEVRARSVWRTSESVGLVGDETKALVTGKNFECLTQCGVHGLDKRGFFLG